MRAVRSWSLMSKFQQIVDHLVLPLNSPESGWAHDSSPIILSVWVPSPKGPSPRRIAHKSLALKWLIKNQLKMITIGCEYQRGRSVAHKQMSVCTCSMHIRHIIALLRHYQQSQMVAIIAAMFRRGNNFLAKGRWKKGNEFKQTYRSARTCQPGGLQAGANSTIKKGEAGTQYTPKGMCL